MVQYFCPESSKTREQHDDTLTGGRRKKHYLGDKDKSFQLFVKQLQLHLVSLCPRLCRAISPLASAGDCQPMAITRGLWLRAAKKKGRSIASRMGVLALQP